MKIRLAGETAVGMLYPRRCPVCFEIIRPKGRLICPGCVKQLSYLQEPLCRHCGTPLEKEEAEYCLGCRTHPRDFAAGVSVFRYASVSRALLAMKYHDKREFADFFAWEIVRRHGKTILAWEPDALIPVPLHALRRLGRGYNQAELLARRIGKELGIPAETGVLRRVHYTSPQRKLTGAQRRKNLEHAFAARRTELRTVVLVDDIYTTGSTAQACTAALLRAGVERVYMVTAACGQSS